MVRSVVEPTFCRTEGPLSLLLKAMSASCGGTGVAGLGGAVVTFEPGLEGCVMQRREQGQTLECSESGRWPWVGWRAKLGPHPRACGPALPPTLFPHFGQPPSFRPERGGRSVWPSFCPGQVPCFVGLGGAEAPRLQENGGRPLVAICRAFVPTSGSHPPCPPTGDSWTHKSFASGSHRTRDPQTGGTWEGIAVPSSPGIPCPHQHPARWPRHLSHAQNEATSGVSAPVMTSD